MQATVRRQDGTIETFDVPDKHGPSCMCCGQIATGISRATDTHLRRVQENPDVWEARVGVAIMGHFRDSKCDDPFSDDFEENYAQGRGMTKEDAVRSMWDSMRSMADSLWAE